MASIEHFRKLLDRQNRTVIGVLSKNEANSWAYGCFECDAEFLSVGTFEKHQNQNHKIDLKPTDPNPTKPALVPNSNAVPDIVTIELISSDDEEIKQEPKSPKKNRGSAYAPASRSNQQTNNNHYCQQPRLSTSGGTRKSTNDEGGDVSLKRCHYCVKAFLKLRTLDEHHKICIERAKSKKKTQHDGCNESRDGRNFLIGHVKLEHSTEAGENSIDSLQQNVQMQSPHQNEVLPSSETAPQTKSNIEKP